MNSLFPLTVGAHTKGHEKCKVLHLEPSSQGFHISIGKYCTISDQVTFLGACNRRTEFISTYHFEDKPVLYVHKGPIVIGNDVWIGQGATIQSGVTIGDGAVIAANAHVVKSIPPYAIVGGNPARTIKMRFSKDQRDALIRISWWNWPHEQIPLLSSDHVDEFCKQYDEQYAKKETLDTSSEHSFWGC